MPGGPKCWFGRFSFFFFLFLSPPPLSDGKASRRKDFPPPASSYNPRLSTRRTRRRRPKWTTRFMGGGKTSISLLNHLESGNSGFRFYFYSNEILVGVVRPERRRHTRTIFSPYGIRVGTANLQPTATTNRFQLGRRLYKRNIRSNFAHSVDRV